MDNNKGSLILKALSPDADEAQVIAYLEKRAKSIPPEKIPELLESLPVVLSRNVAEETGQLVIERLEELGAIAMFLPAEEGKGVRARARTRRPPQASKLHPKKIIPHSLNSSRSIKSCGLSSPCSVWPGC